MSSGFVPTILPFTLSPLVSSKNLNREMQMFTSFAPKYREVGFLRKEYKVATYLYNGNPTASLNVDSLTTTGQIDGISNSLTIPTTIPAKGQQRVDIVIGLEGPPTFEATISFNSSCSLDPVITLKGSRVPIVSGVIGYLMCEHDWSQGLSESFQWATDVMIAHDRTEQRVQLRNRARHSLSLKFVESGKVRRHLENILGARRVRFYFTPMFGDVQMLTTPITALDATVTIDTLNTDFEIDRWVVVWDAYNNYEIKNVALMSESVISVGTPFLKDWPVGSFIAPGRYANILTTRKIVRHTDDTAEFEVLAELMNETRLPGRFSVESYDGYAVNDFPITWEDPQESLDNKWVKLDNITGVVAYDIQSLEPIRSRTLKFLLQGRAQIGEFMRFLYERDGKLVPFWVVSDEDSIEIALTANSGQNKVVVVQMDYERSLLGSASRTHLEFELFSGEIFRMEVASVMQTLDGNEELTFTAPLPFTISESSVLRNNWMEFVRFDSDDIKIKWDSTESMTSSIPVVTLP